LPIGNLTSQLFANVYLHELDKFIKHKLRVRYYLRYTDDFVFVHQDRSYLEELVNETEDFLRRELALSLHENKIIIRKFSQGIDFLGYIVLPYCRLLRTKTRRRMLKKMKVKITDFQLGVVSCKSLEQTRQSYLGLLKRCCGKEIENKLEKLLR